MTPTHLYRDALSLFEVALQECGVESALERKMVWRVEGERSVLFFKGQEVDLTGVRHLRIVSVGKASVSVLTGFLARVPPVHGLDIQGILIAQDCPEDLPDNFEFFAGGHPVPNQASFDGARAALRLVSEASKLQDAFCLFSISGGASAMMELPLAPDISLEETIVFYRLLVRSGATISEINCIRKHFSAVKGGRLALAAGCTPSFTLLVSDVPPRHLDALGSGPTMPDPSTVEDCRRLLCRYRLEEALPESIRAYFASSALEETPKPGQIGSPYSVLLDSDDLGAAAARQATSLGYHVVRDDTCDDWSYLEAAKYLVSRLRPLRTEHERVCLISTGEVTVSVPADLPHRASRRGGRNQHFVLYAATLLVPSDQSMVLLSAGSDGIDGDSEAAGAIVDGDTLRGSERSLEAQLALDDFDSSTWLESRGATIVTKSTGNNLRDLRILIAERCVVDPGERSP